MTEFRSDFLREAASRGFIHQCTDPEALDAQALEGRIVAYVGYDCTADSLHVGSLLSIMLLRRFQRSGHKPIVLMGGGTSRVGDPSGKDASRQLQSDEQIAANMAGIKRVFAKYLSFGEGPTDAVMVNNADWLDGLNYIEFLRDFGRHFSVNRMLSFDSVKLRLDREQPLSFLEFNYMVLQAYDFLQLAKSYDCRLQMGGSDQWGNIVNGVELARRVESLSLHGLTTPLVTTASGAKMGKTAEGAVWLNAERLSPYDYWQFWRNTEGADVGRFLRYFTELPLDEIARLEVLEGDELKEAKVKLANEATKLCHGEEAARMAAQTAGSAFLKGKESVLALVGQAGSVNAGLPLIEVSHEEFEKGVLVYELMRRSGLTSSNGEARRLIKNGGARLNDEVIGDESRIIRPSDLIEDKFAKLSAGKKRHALVRVT